MTKAEAKKYLDNYRKMYAELAPEEFLEALDVMLNEPSLPSTLNKAAEEYAGVNYDCETGTDAFYHHIETEAFKAGAEHGFSEGYQSGKKDTIEKALKWITEKIDVTTPIPTNEKGEPLAAGYANYLKERQEVINQVKREFRKAMEE